MILHWNGKLSEEWGRKETHLEGYFFQTTGSLLNHPWMLCLPTSVVTGVQVPVLTGALPPAVLDPQCQFLVCELLPFQSACRPLFFCSVVAVFQNYKLMYAPAECFPCNSETFITENRSLPAPNPHVWSWEINDCYFWGFFWNFSTRIQTYIYIFLCVWTYVHTNTHT